MMRAIAAALAGVVAMSQNSAAAADDVDLIPSSVLDTRAAPAPTESSAKAQQQRSTLHLRAFVEDAVSGWSSPRQVPVPYPPALAIAWQNRTSLDVAALWKPASSLTLALSDRLNAFEQDGQKILSRNTIRNDLREASVTWEPSPGSYLEAGRINVRDGAALGFNPTDFFKTRTLVGQASLDPSVIRQNRLGTLMFRAQTIWANGSASVAYAPKITQPSATLENDPLGVDPRFDATNAAHRVLCALNFELLDLSPQLLAYFELHRSKIGANVSRPIGDAVVAYAEWAGGPEENLIARATAFGKATASLPPNAPTLPPTSANTAFRNDVAAGFSWTIAATMTINVEYHFHDAGFTPADWNNWYRLGSAPNAPAALPGALWFVRGYATDQQEPVAQDQLFVRASWPRALIPELEFDAFAFVSLLDGSVLSQLSANYYASNTWTASAYVSANFGDGRSERGSFPQRGNAIFQLTRYL
jgi:hypothetical protein